MGPRYIRYRRYFTYLVDTADIQVLKEGYSMTHREKLRFVEGVDIGERLELARMLSESLSESECKRLANYIQDRLSHTEDEFLKAPVEMVELELIPVSKNGKGVSRKTDGEKKDLSNLW